MRRPPKNNQIKKQNNNKTIKNQSIYEQYRNRIDDKIKDRKKY